MYPYPIKGNGQMTLEEFTLAMMLLGIDRETREGQCKFDYCDRYVWVVDPGKKYNQFKVFTSAMREKGDFYVGSIYHQRDKPFKEILDAITAYLDKTKPTEKINND